ncbi:MAG: ribbon-helix-helix domain-containing protein [Clostridium sp.]
MRIGGLIDEKRVNITLEDKVIQRIDQYADEHYTSRSGAITMLIVEATEEPNKRNNGILWVNCLEKRRIL